MQYDYTRFLSTRREVKSSRQREYDIEEFYSDRSRILYCSSFRRLQQKAQVFSLEPNSNVRSRLTHSLEVSDLGRFIANDIAYSLAQRGQIEQDQIPEIVAVVENACLMHDIGNPPFGHFGEAAIRSWADKELPRMLPVRPETIPDLHIPDLPDAQAVLSDFQEFDGNPQGFRIMTKLHTDVHEYSLNMTFATLACALKYARSPGEKVERKGVVKKAGYFRTEESVVRQIREETGLKPHHRNPFTYIMEAADDIAYCMSDIIDGMEKRLLTEETFIRLFQEEWEKRSFGPLPAELANAPKYGFSRDLSVPWSNLGRREAVQSYLDHEPIFYEGTADTLIPDESAMGRILSVCKAVSRKTLYASAEAETVEITGFATITGILKAYECLLVIPCEDFKKLLENETPDGLAYEQRLQHRLGHRYVKAYKYALDRIEAEKGSDAWRLQEWWHRVHLIVDHIAGMTDEFALQTYQMLNGTRPLR